MVTPTKPTRKLFTLNAAELFFFNHAGSSFNPCSELSADGRIRGAVLLAYAERELQRGIAHVEWEDDPEPWDGDEPYDGPLSNACIIRDDGMIVGSLCGVCSDGADDRARVVEAELALEYLTGGGTS